MQNFLRFSGLATAVVAFAACAPSAVAQELRNHDLCRQTSTYRLSNWATVTAIY
jgi:hypothetical protein